MTRDNILLRRPGVPKNVTLPNGRIFYGKYGGVSHKNLPRNITFRRTRTIGPHRQGRQKCAGMISSLFKTGLKLHGEKSTGSNSLQLAKCLREYQTFK